MRSAKRPTTPQADMLDQTGFAVLEPALIRCGITFDSHKLTESYNHRAHIYAAQAQQGRSSASR